MNEDYVKTILDKITVNTHIAVDYWEKAQSGGEDKCEEFYKNVLDLAAEIDVKATFPGLYPSFHYKDREYHCVEGLARWGFEIEDYSVIDMETARGILAACEIKDNLVYMPKFRMDRKLFSDVKQQLTMINGKWNTSKQAFLFQEDPTELMEGLVDGKDMDLKKKYQYFATPPELADYLVELAEIEPMHDVLEPSAGQGAIVDAIVRAHGMNDLICCYEIMDINRKVLEKNEAVYLLDKDFMDNSDISSYDRIVANPPFSKNRDIDHILEMYRRLRPGGRIVSVASKHWQLSSNRKETNFREWLDDVDARVIEVDAGTFKESGTMIGTSIIVIDKKSE